MKYNFVASETAFSIWFPVLESSRFLRLYGLHVHNWKLIRCIGIDCQARLENGSNAWYCLLAYLISGICDIQASREVGGKGGRLPQGLVLWGASDCKGLILKNSSKCVKGLNPEWNSFWRIGDNLKVGEPLDDHFAPGLLLPLCGPGDIIPQSYLLIVPQ